VEDSELIEINSMTFDKMIKGNIEIAIRMLRKLSIRLREAERRIEGLQADGRPASVARPVVAAKPRAATAAGSGTRLEVEGEGTLFPVSTDETLIGRFDPVTELMPDVDLTQVDLKRSARCTPAGAGRRGVPLTEGRRAQRDVRQRHEVGHRAAARPGRRQGQLRNGQARLPRMTAAARGAQALVVGLLAVAPADARHPFPFRTAVVVVWGDDGGSDAFRHDVGRALTQSLSEGCFAAVEFVQGSAAVSADLLSVELSNVTEGSDSVRSQFAPAGARS
jgi:hypothetical protein